MNGQIKFTGERYIFPMSSQQKRMWYQEELEPTLPVYTITTALEIKGDLCTYTLENSIRTLIERHESLRSTFSYLEGEPKQIIHSQFQYDLTYKEIKDSEQIETLVQQECSRGFDLEEGPLFSTLLIQTDKNEYVFIWNVHHIILDGLSMGVLFRELSVLYNNKGVLDELDIQYVDYSEWHRKFLDSQEIEKQLEHWKEKLNGEIPQCKLPTDKKRPKRQSFNGKSINYQVSSEIHSELIRLSKKEKVTLNMILMSAFKVLLYKYTGQHDIVIGTPSAGRNRSEIENTVGLFVNTLLVKTNVSENPSFLEIVNKIKLYMLDAVENQDVPLDKIIDNLQIERGPGNLQAIQVMYNFQPQPLSELNLKGLTFKRIEVEKNVSKFDLTLSVNADSDGIFTLFEYNTDLFEEDTIHRMARNFESLLSSIIISPNQKLSDISIVSPQEQAKIDNWKQTKVEYSTGTIHQKFVDVAQNIPEVNAIKYKQYELTYSALDQQSNMLANYLVTKGVNKGDHVAVILERSPELIISILGIMKTGAVYVPIDPTNPRARIEYILTDADVKYIIHDEGVKLQSDVVNVNIKGTSWMHNSVALDFKLNGDDVAYMIYTSGTTGSPKGVLIEHKGVINLVEDYNSRKQIRVGQGCSFLASQSFDASIYEIFTSLLSGGTLHIVPSEIRLNNLEVIKWFLQNGIENLFLPPYMIKEFIEYLSQFPPNKFKMNRIMVGVEPILESDLVKINALIENVLIINAYGPSEATVITTSLNFDANNEKSNVNVVSIGRPLQNTKVFVLDSDLNQVPIGVPGELYIHGVGVGRGYYNQQNLSEEKFVYVRISDKEYRCYKSGDYVKFDRHGHLHFLGRMDNQVKIRGMRIELGEIKSLLDGHPSVNESYVTVVGNTGTQKQLVAYVVSKKNENLNGSILRDYLKLFLPLNIIPSNIIILDEFPINHSGKIDKTLLPLPTFDRHLEKVDPRNQTEENISNIWKSVMKENDIGITDNFFELGGHSLMATQILSRIKEQYQVKISLIDFFDEPTIEKLAMLISTSEKQPVRDNAFIKMHR